MALFTSTGRTATRASSAAEAFETSGLGAITERGATPAATELRRNRRLFIRGHQYTQCRNTLFCVYKYVMGVARGAGDLYSLPKDSTECREGSSRWREGKTMTRLINALWICALVLSVAFAQADRGTITGTVTDPSGAIVAGARVSVEHTETHNVLETITSSTGNFTLPQLPAGIWDVTVEAPGFKRFRSLHNTIEVAQTLRV